MMTDKGIIASQTSVRGSFFFPPFQGSEIKENLTEEDNNREGRFI